MTPGVDKAAVANFFAWVRTAPPEAKAIRLAGIRGLLLDGTDDVERARVEKLIAEVEADHLKAEAEAAKAPVAPVAADAVPSTETSPTGEQVVVEHPLGRKRPPAVKIYDPKRRGYMRSTREEGLGDEVREMSEEASGSPFFDESETKKTASTKEVAEVIKRMQLEKVAEKGKPEKKKKR